MARKYSPELKRALLLEFQKSGVSLTEFGHRKGISPSTLCHWRKDMELDSSGARVSKSNFIELGVDKDCYQISVGSVDIKVPTNVSADRVAELVRALC